MLLSDLRSDRLGIEMVAGGCDYDCHRRRFRTKLITMAMLGYDRVLIEPSGIFDVDEFFDILHEDPLDRRYEIANVLTIVSADLEENLSEEADYLLASQAAQAGRLIPGPGSGCPGHRGRNSPCQPGPGRYQMSQDIFSRGKYNRPGLGPDDRRGLAGDHDSRLCRDRF